MRAIATAPDHLPLPEAETLDDLARDWPALEDAALADWEPGDGEPADREPADPGRPEAGSREVLKAGRWDRARGDGGGFAAGGVADAVPPGPALAGFAADACAAGLGRLSDDELIGVMRAARRLASWAAAMELAAIGDLWRRRVAEEDAGDTGAACHADDEIAAALTLTGRAADRALDLAIALRRLPLTSEALAAGDIDLPRAMVIADEVTGLDDEHAAAVEHAIAGSAPGRTTGQLRAATRRAVMTADPSAARQRKERAQQDARVERWDEHAGTAALAGRDLPPASVLAADQNLTALARQLKAAGVPGTMDTLRAEAFLTLLSGTSVGSLLPDDLPAPREPADNDDSAGPAIRSDSADPSARLSGTVDPSADLSGTADPAARLSGTMDPAARLSGTMDPSARLSGTMDPSAGLGGTADPSVGLSGTVNLTMPLTTWLGLSDAPGNASGYGPLDASDSRDLARALAARAGNRWCLTFTDARGRPVAHGCARAGPREGRGARAGPREESGANARAGPRAESRTGVLGESRAGDQAIPRSTGDKPTARSQTGDLASPPSRAGPSSRPEADCTGDRWTFTITLFPGSACDHAWQTTAYQPSPALRHLVETRHSTCVFPGCRRPATQCDKDHTVPHDRGGKTCLCNLAPLCRRHHRAKQARGWALQQVSPGVLTWSTPSGRHYVA